jgi:thiol-disulfide isomerase/thioredoxin
VETSVPPSAAIESPSQLADEPPSQLGIGDPNPGLKLAKWIKGEPVQTPLTGKVHVVEFWATWCGPCRVGMPHISELQSEYGEDVTFIGVTREDEATVASFLQSESPDGRNWQEVIQYRLAIDQDDWTNTAYMKAAGQNGIPCAFVVGRDGVVEWIGHPASIDEPLQQIVAGQYDRDRAIAEFKQRERMQEVALEVNRLVRAKDWDGALKLLDELESESGKSSSMMAFRLNILEVAGRAAEASAVRAELVELAWDDAGQLNAIAWQTATSGDGTDRELALKAAQRASELRDDEDPAILDTLARCHYELGDLDEAIRWQRQAVEHNAGHPEIDETLQSYLKEQAAATEPATSPEAALSPPEGEPAEPSEQPAVDRDS